MRWTRREWVKAGVAGTLASVVSRKAMGAVARRDAFLDGTGGAGDDGPCFAQRGYYITFMRGPLFTFETWKGILDGVKQDGGNMVILWMAGAFPSRKFPITWKYNAEHENVKHNFTGKLIDYGHSLGLKVLLCLTPYGYDGVNQYALEHPELKALNEYGNYTKAFGLDAWGFNLNPYRPEAHEFMLEYTREMLDFYPNADGLLLGSSDYAISYCKACPKSYYEKEFEFVRQISDELWARKPEATIAVYPHYFTGSNVPGMKEKAARKEFDPRWSLFFTPHSAYLNTSLMRQAKSTLYWDPSPSFGQPKLIRAAAQTAKKVGATGFVPSFEPWNYVFTGPDMGHQFLVGQRASPFGFGWLKPGESPMNVLLLRLDRLAYREFSRNPDCSIEQFRAIVTAELLAGHADAEVLDDLFFLEESVFLDRTWDSTAVIASPEYVKGRIELGEVGPARISEYRDRLKRIASIAQRYVTAANPSTRELGQTAEWIVTQWKQSSNRSVLDDHLR
jgi:hypothetical protein